MFAASSHPHRFAFQEWLLTKHKTFGGKSFRCFVRRALGDCSAFMKHCSRVLPYARSAAIQREGG
jgi:hypothetical protein